jgi:ketosteroid isomerase-like protein
MRRTFLLMAIALAPALAAGPEDQIRAAEKSWAAAVTSANLPALEKMLGDRLIYAHSSGVIESKADYIGRLRSGKQKYEVIDQQSITVQIYGNTAVAHSKLRMSGKSDDRLFDDQLMAMHVWVKQGGAWRLVAHQTTKLTQ